MATKEVSATEAYRQAQEAIVINNQPLQEELLATFNKGVALHEEAQASLGPAWCDEHYVVTLEGGKTLEVIGHRGWGYQEPGKASSINSTDCWFVLIAQPNTSLGRCFGYDRSWPSEDISCVRLACPDAKAVTGDINYSDFSRFSGVKHRQRNYSPILT